MTTARAAELRAACLRCGQRGLGSFADGSPFFLSHDGAQVQLELARVRQLGDLERHTFAHHAGNQCHGARQPIQLRHQQHRTAAAGVADSGGELGALVVVTAGDLAERAENLPPSGGGGIRAGGFLSLHAEP